MVDAPTIAQRFSDHFKRGRQAPYQLCEYWVGVDGETGELGAEWADKPHRLVFDLLHHAVFQENEIESLQRQVAELRAELDRAIDERDEARQEPWPKWADEIRKCLEGYGVDPGDEWDLPEQFEIWIAGVVENETARAEVLAEENARLKALPLKDEVERVLDALLEQWTAFEASVGNQEEAYYKLAKYARPYWEQAQSLLSRLRAGEQEGWRSMDSAPKDGTPVWAFLNDSGIRLIHWVSPEKSAEELGGDPREYAGVWAEVSDHSEQWEPDWWLPKNALPAAPSEHGGERG